MKQSRYRVVRRTESGESWFAIHEAHYDDADRVWVIARTPAAPFGETIEELDDDLRSFAEAFGRPHLEYAEVPEAGAVAPTTRRDVSVPVFLDVEASGFGDGSYAIEVAFSDEQGRVESHLIRPEPQWVHWDDAAERDAHHISRRTLEAEGKPAAWVASRLNEALAGKTVHTDAPDFDRKWLEPVFRAASVEPTFRIEQAYLRIPDVPGRMDELAREARALTPGAHRAAWDVQFLVEYWRLATAAAAERTRARSGVDALPPGDELDRRVAELVEGTPGPDEDHDDGHVMTAVHSRGGFWRCLPEYEEGDECVWKPLPFSRSIAAIWKVVTDPRFGIDAGWHWLVRQGAAEGWTVEITRLGGAGERIDEVSAFGPAAEVAICRAFLKARNAGF